MPAPHWYFQGYRPDEVAECWDDVPDDLYRALWRVMRHVPAYKGETPPEPDMFCLAKYWEHLSEDEQSSLNALAEKEEAADEAWWELNPYIPEDERDGDAE